MVSHADPTRSSGGFSLDDAARLYRRSRPGMSTPCPTCGTGMRSVLSEVPDQRTHVLRCDRCERSVVFERSAAGAAGANPLGSEEVRGS